MLPGGGTPGLTHDEGPPGASGSSISAPPPATAAAFFQTPSTAAVGDANLDTASKRAVTSLTAMPSLPARPTNKQAPPTYTTSPTSTSMAGVSSSEPPPPTMPALSAKPSAQNGLSSSGMAPAKAGPSLPARPPVSQKHKAGASLQNSGTGSSSHSADPPSSAGVASTSAALEAPNTHADTPQSYSRAMPTLPPRQAAPAAGPVLDPEEPPETCAVRRQVHDVRVMLIRAAQRLGSDHENALVKQVLYRLKLAEKLKAPWHGRGRRPEPERAAARDAARLEALEGPEAALDLKITVLLVGMTGAGKTQLIHSLLDRPGAAVDAFSGATSSVQTVRGTVHGMRMVFIDTPGLQVAASQATRNTRILRDIAQAYKRHRPDLVLYVDRMDTGSSRGSSGRPEGAGELPALSALSAALGPALWLNTIIALTHAGMLPPQERRTALPYDAYVHQRCTQLQKVIRAASGDERLMNPVALVDSHPGCRTNAQGQQVVGSGIPWKPHLYLMIVAAKLLADTEAMLQMKGGHGRAGGAVGSQPAALQHMLAAQQRQMPLPYLTQQATQFSRPLEYPGHDLVMAIRDLQCRAVKSQQPAEQRAITREIRGRLRQARVAQQQAVKLQAQFRNATLAGGKVVPEPPRLARRAAAATQPLATYRYRVPEATDGWVVRPHIEQHGMDNTDGIEGLYLEKTGVIRPPDAPAGAAASKPFSPAGLCDGQGRQQKRGRPSAASDTGADVLAGVPYHHFISAQCSKHQCMLQARTESTLYHDPLGRLTTSISADAQTTGTPGVNDALVTVKADLRRRNTLCNGNAATVGAQLTRLAVNGRPHRGPLACGLRVQDSARGNIMGAPLEVNAAAAVLASHTPGGFVPNEHCTGINVEATTEMQGALGCRHSAPLTVNVTGMRYKGEASAALGLMLALRGDGKRDSLATRLQVSNRSRAAITLRAHSGKHWWLGLALMTWPLAAWVVELAKRRLRHGKTVVAAEVDPSGGGVLPDPHAMLLQLQQMHQRGQLQQ